MKIIKGVLVGVQVRGLLMSRTLFGLGGFVFISLLSISLIFLRDLPSYFEEGISPAPALYTLVLILSVTLLLYFLAREDYYYFELTEHSVTVRNLLKQYQRTFEVSQIDNVKFDHAAFSGSSVTFALSHGTTQKTQTFKACGFSTEDFLELKSELESRNITCFDPSGYFFKVR